MKTVSDANGPFTLTFNLNNFLIAGMIIFFSSDFFLNSALCGLRPRMPIFGFFFYIFLTNY